MKILKKIPNKNLKEFSTGSPKTLKQFSRLYCYSDSFTYPNLMGD